MEEILAKLEELSKGQTTILLKMDVMMNETNERFDKADKDVNARFDESEKKFNARFDETDKSNNARFNKIDNSIVQIENIVTQLVTMVGTVITKQNEMENMKKDIVNIQHDFRLLSQKTTQHEFEINRLKNAKN
jgi:chromosome segregation ATPase